jgi:hypothetical protein
MGARRGTGGAHATGLGRGYAGFVETSAAPLRRREPPSGTPVLIVNLGTPLEVGAPGRRTIAHTGSFVARLSDLPATTAFTGTSAGVQVDFSPLGLHLFCALAIDELPDPAVGLEELLGDEGRALTEMLSRTRRTGSRASICSTPRSSDASPPPGRRHLAWRGPGERSRRARAGSRSAA